MVTTGVVLASNRYVKPAGYYTILAPAGYKPFNGFLGGDKTYGPRSVTAQRWTLTFTAAPTNASTLTIPDAGTSKVFTFTYAGSPGAGIIPLVSGGGTAAQAATAAQVALAAQLTDWVVTNPSSGVLRLVAKQVGAAATVSRSDTTNISISNSPSQVGLVLPARFGKALGLLSAGN